MQIIGKSTGSYLTKRWAETLNAEPEEERSADEIAADIIKRAGLVFGDGDSE